MEPEHLQRLNPPQYEAVVTTAGPLLILAGAGSGKTRVLTRRVAHLLHEGASPESILAVTFTKKAANEMKERVVDLAGSVGERVWVSTFHSAACRILRQEIEALGYTKRFSIYDEDDQLRLVRALLSDHLEKVGADDAKKTLAFIDWHKNRMDDPDSLTESFRGHDRQLSLRVWRAYDEALRAADALDFNDLIGATVRLFREHPHVLERWQQRLTYLLVDEYQDTNRGQYELLTLLAAKHRNLAVVGDDDQSIYGFRGADVSNILGFERDYPDAKVIRLEQNYRCAGNILKVANAVVARNPGRMPKQLWTESPAGPPVTLLVADTLRAEADRIARAAHKLRRQGFAYGDMAIIYRTNATSRFFESALREAAIPHRVIGGRRLYEHREVRDLLAYLRLVSNPADDAAFLRVVNVPSRGVGTKTLSKLREAAAERGEPLLRTARSAAGSGRGAEGISTFVQIVDLLTEAARFDEPDELAQRALRETGLLALLEEDRQANGSVTIDARQRLGHLEELMRDARIAMDRATEARTPAERLRFWLDHIALSSQADEVPEGGEVTLLTVHNAKGLEFGVVFVVQMMEGFFPHSKSAEEGVEEERRLAYVAFTRAMRRLVISRSRHGSSEERVSPSRFLYGIPADAIDGDPPTDASEPPDPKPRGLPEEQRRKLAAHLQHQQERQSDLAPEGTYTLVRIRSLDQLRRDARVHHNHYGFGVVRRLRENAVDVQFGRGLIRLPLRGVDLQLVTDP